MRAVNDPADPVGLSRLLINHVGTTRRPRPFARNPCQLAHPKTPPPISCPPPNPARAFDAAADEALLDLEVAVPPDRNAHAHGLVVEALSGRRAADLEAVGGLAAGLRLPQDLRMRRLN